MPNIFVEFIGERGQNDAKRKFRFSLDVVYNLFTDKFGQNVWPVFLSSKIATYQFLSLRDSTITSPVSKTQALALTMVHNVTLDINGYFFDCASAYAISILMKSIFEQFLSELLRG